MQGLYGRNNKGAVAIATPDPALIAVLIHREHSRLSNQVKTLARVLRAPFSDKEHQRLVQLAANWRSLLAFDDGTPKLADALEAFIAAYQQQPPDQESLHDEVVLQAGIYRMGHWALVKHFIPGVTDCLDNFGSVLPKYREAFKRRYEADGNLSVEAQSQVLKAQYALIQNRRDPYRHEEMRRRGLVTADGIVPMGVKEALALIEREEAQATQPAKRGVVAWVADRFRRQ
ncbi:hypothetical protein IEG05_14045 [Pseudomonas kunmingensis]|uniref:hypothetical protein n=1 Tax=Stutzerimonas kunmingensis TaxID=1211807 RepID=UPI001746E9C9|nr:hypothetical protein [Stutzerimonas kunmingensis]MBD3876341.1 hypothetical protein [Stutzerimonas kunmingensis]